MYVTTPPPCTYIHCEEILLKKVTVNILVKVELEEVSCLLWGKLHAKRHVATDSAVIEVRVYSGQERISSEIFTKRL
jgi:hypothetical protein